LNFAADQRAAALVAAALALVIPVATFRPAAWLWLVVALLLGAALWLNSDLYRLFFRRGGPWFAVKGFLLQQFYYLYSLFSLPAGVAIYLARSLTRRVEGRTKRTGS
jgi:membrane protein implicated in regulation of membrane protease activity